MTDFISEFNAYLETEKNCSDTTVKAYTADAEEFLSYLSDTRRKSPTAAEKEDVEAYVTYIKVSGKSASTINRKLASVRCYYSFLRGKGKVRSNPASGVKLPRVERNSIDYLSVEDVERLLSQPDDSLKGIRDKALLETMYATGMRAGELCSLRLSDLNLSIGFVSCTDEKGKVRMIPLGRPAKAALKEYINGGSRQSFIGNREDSGVLFVNFLGQDITRQGIWKILKQYGAKAGIEDRISPQILRNSFAAHMIMNGADLKSLQELLGHEDITATRIFLSLSKNRIMDVYDRTFPRAK